MARTGATRVGRWWGLLLALLVGTATAVTPVLVASGPAGAALGNADDTFVSLNMQGSDNGLRWTSEVGPAVQSGALVALQEVGNGPPPPNWDMAHLGWDHPVPQTPATPAGLPRSVSQTPWRYQGQDYQIYYLQTDPQRIDGTTTDRWVGGRVNLAIATREVADEVRVLENPRYDRNHASDYRARRILGLRYGNTVYYNVHARGTDVDDLLDQVRAATLPNERWVLVGDFNRNIRDRSDADARDTVGLQGNEQLVRTGRPTHQSGGELDYAVTNGMPAFDAYLPAGRSPDHYPIYFSPRGAAHQLVPQAVRVYASGFTNASTGAALDTPDGGGAGGRVITHPRKFNVNQMFVTMVLAGHWYALRNPSSGLCPGLAPGIRPRGADEDVALTMQSCGSPDAQWSPEDLAAEGGPLRYRNSSDPELCLSGPVEHGDAVAAPCGDGAEQRWWDNARNIPAEAWSAPVESVRLRNVASGGMLDARGGATGNLTEIITHEEKDVDNQKWFVETVDPSENLVRIRGLASGRCVDVKESDTAGPGAQSVLYDCDDDTSRNDDTGHHWQAESYADGSVRFRNEATHLCLVGSTNAYGMVTAEDCYDDPQQRWQLG